MMPRRVAAQRDSVLRQGPADRAGRCPADAARAEPGSAEGLPGEVHGGLDGGDAGRGQIGHQ